MAKGSSTPGEWLDYADTSTGLEVRQATTRANSHDTHFYFHDPAWSPDSAAAAYTTLVDPTDNASSTTRMWIVELPASIDAPKDQGDSQSEE